MPRFYDSVKDDVAAIHQDSIQRTSDAVARALTPLQSSVSDALEMANRVLAKIAAEDGPGAKADAEQAIKHIKAVYEMIGS